jgi:hypothetical protein
MQSTSRTTRNYIKGSGWMPMRNQPGVDVPASSLRKSCGRTEKVLGEVPYVEPVRGREGTLRS